MKSTRDTDYIHIGIQYYIAGRQSALAKLMPVTANIFHHSFEMLFKAKLLSKSTPDKLQNNYRHNLCLMWPDFISMTGNKSLKSFDKTIKSLHMWEDIRYPSYPEGKSVSMTMGIKKNNKTRLIENIDEKTTHFELSLEEIDELFKSVIISWPLNPMYIKQTLASSFGVGLKAYEKDNLHMLW